MNVGFVAMYYSSPWDNFWDFFFYRVISQQCWLNKNS